MKCPACSEETFPIERAGQTVHYCEIHGDIRDPDANWWRAPPKYPVPAFYARGYDLFEEWGRMDPQEVISLALDIGANVGQSTRTLKRAFPNCRVYAFEPVKKTYEELKSKVERFSDVSCHRLAFSNRNGNAYVTNNLSVNSAIVASPGPDTEMVTCITGDEFCSSNGINHIDYLKIDTEGHDLDVLRGFSNTLSRGAIRYVEVEAGMNALNKKHVMFTKFITFFSQPAHIFDLFGIYEQVRETAHGSPLRRANLVFKRR